METSVFHTRWTPARKAKFARYRIEGMSVDWAVYWAMLNRSKSSPNLYKAEAVEKLWAKEIWYQRCWSKPMEHYHRKYSLPPQELIDSLQKQT